MTIEEKIYYFDEIYEIEGLKNDIDSKEFFDLEMLKYLKDKMFLSLEESDWIQIIRNGANNQEYMNIVIELICKFGLGINNEKFKLLLEDDKIYNNFLKAICNHINNNKSMKATTKRLLLSNDRFVNSILKDNKIEIDFIYDIFDQSNINKERVLFLLKDERLLNIFMNYSLSRFLNVIKKYNISEELKSLIIEKINATSYMEKLNLLKNKNVYNRETGEPEYLEDLYYEMEEKLINDAKRDILISLRYDSLPEIKNKAEEILDTDEGMDILLKEILEPKFSEIINILNLDKSLYQLQKEKLYEELKNYQKYDLTTIKDLLCRYCFNDISTNIKLRLKTLIEYAKDNKEALKLLKDDIDYLIKLYAFLTNDKLECNPLELISNIDINKLIIKTHKIFSDEVNKKTDISDILKSDNYKMIDQVKVIDMDIPINRSYFLIHCDNKGYDLESYKENARKRNRLCTSILDNNHISTFVNGVIFGYCNIKEPIYSAIPFDGQTNQRNNDSGRPQYRSVLTNVDRFMHRTTTKYNEITYNTNNELIMPSYILVIDRDPNEIELKTAKEFEIPILIYHPKIQNYEYEEGYTKGEPFDYEKRTFDFIPNTDEIYLENTI